MSSYVKKKLDDYYVKLINIISSSKDNNVISFTKYENVAPLINNLDWEGNIKKSTYNEVLHLDGTCNSLYKDVSLFITKTQIVYNQLNDNLQLLKSKIEEYNNGVNLYQNALRRYNLEKNKQIIETMEDINE